jgi:hypothetical protein
MCDLFGHRIEHAALLPHARRRTFGSVVSASPNRRSNTTRGLFCVGSGVFALFHTIVLVYGHA